MYGVENRFKVQLLLGLKGSPLVGGTIPNFVSPYTEVEELELKHPRFITAPIGLNGVVLICWIGMLQWDSFKAQRKYHFKAVFHAMH